MTLVIILFLLIVAISFLLAYRSMKDFREIPKGDQYSLFLIRQPHSLNKDLLEQLWNDSLQEGQILSLERLFKGRSSALVVFGSKRILTKYTNLLNLVELEDYTNCDQQSLTIWEIRIKDPTKLENASIFLNFPHLQESEQVFWQLVLQAKRGADKIFSGQLRAVVLTPDTKRRRQLTTSLQDLNGAILLKVPRPFSLSKMFEFYQKRSLESKQ